MSPIGQHLLGYLTSQQVKSDATPLIRLCPFEKRTSKKSALAFAKR